MGPAVRISPDRNRRVHPMRVCRKCAVRFEPIRANSRFFNTSVKCFRAGLVEDKSLKRVVSAVGIESSTERQTKDLAAHGKQS